MKRRGGRAVLTGLLDVTMNILFALAVMVSVASFAPRDLAKVRLPELIRKDKSDRVGNGQASVFVMDERGEIFVRGQQLGVGAAVRTADADTVSLLIDEKAPFGPAQELIYLLKVEGKRIEYGVKSNAR